MSRILRHASLPPLAASAVAIALGACSHAKAPPPDAAVPVSVAKVEQKPLPDVVAAVGTVEAINSVAIKSLVDGQLLESRVKDGEDVRKGQLLFKIDPRPAQAALAQMQAALAKDEAARDLAHAQVERYAPVAAKGFISQDQMQQYQTAYEAAVASVKVDNANVQAAKLTLGYTDIFAPIDGRAGRILVQPGNLVKANDTQALLTLNQLSPIFVSFALPGSYVARVRGAQHGAVGANADGFAAPVQGELTFVDNAVDPATNTIKLRATFANADQVLWPGEFVSVALTLGTDAQALVVPDAAVKAGPNGNYVFVVKPDNRAEQRSVEVTRTFEGQSKIAKGLNAGETVVVDGQSRLVDGSKVRFDGASAGSGSAQ